MKLDMFGNKMPENKAELVALMDELSFEALDVTLVVVSYTTPNPREPSNFDGWSAQIDGEIDGEEAVSISCCAWPDKDSLVADLKAIGFPNSHMQIETLMYKEPKK